MSRGQLCLKKNALYNKLCEYVACVNGDLRIEGTETAQTVEGFVQYCWNGTWSTVIVCTDDSTWGDDDGVVACRQLGYGEWYLAL